MINKKVTILGLSVSLAIATAGILLFSNNEGLHFEKATQADSALYTAEINSSVRIVKSLSSNQRYGFQLHGSENYGAFSQKEEGSIEVHNSGDYVISILPQETTNYIMFFLNANDSKQNKVGTTEYKMLYAFPGLQTITVTLDKDVTNFDIYGFSGAQNSFDKTEKVQGDLKMYTLTRNSTPLPSDSGHGNRIMLSRDGGGDEPLKIRNISINYSC